MMVATGLPITAQAPPTTPQAADGPPEGTAPGGGFLGTLMQMLAPQDPAEVAGAGAASVVTQLLDDTTGDVPDDVPLPDGAAALVVPVLPSVQPADIRAAQQLARHCGDTGDALGALTDAATAQVSAGPVSGDLALPDRQGDGLGTAPRAPSTDASALGLQGTMTQPAAMDAATANRTAALDAPVPRQIHTPVGTPGWSDELGTQLHLMADKGHSMASLRLSPEHLGPLEVQISVQDNQASVWFGSTNGDTRAALEQAMPRLRELFAAQGMSLMQSGVFNQSPRDPGRQASAATAQGAVADGVIGSEPGLSVLTKRGLVDAYA